MISRQQSVSFGLRSHRPNRKPKSFICSHCTMK
ncbi:Uncharacterised protein [Vibrio cholerae]|nr:Uncharacterised protein [Vibrio cholerae]